MNKEIWKKINNYNNYEISNLGNVRRYNKSNYYDKRTPKYTYLKPQKLKRGYLQVRIYNDNGFVAKSIHRLVAETFIPNVDNLPQINHKDEDPSNNNVSNLEWCDNWYNSHYGRHIENVKEKHYKKVIQYSENNKIIKKWNSILEASIQNNIDSSSITKVCRGKRKTAGGYIWKYEGS